MNLVLRNMQYLNAAHTSLSSACRQTLRRWSANEICERIEKQPISIRLLLKALKCFY